MDLRLKSNKREFHSWRAMLKRCGNPNEDNYRYYGGRGITVCKRWRVFANFLRDMGPRPEGMTLERKNRNGNYTKRNCKWATNAEQARNSSGNTVYRLGATTLCVGDWEVRLGLSKGSIYHRLETGWPLHKALTIPKMSPHDTRGIYIK
jgi:hypothetical protein